MDSAAIMALTKPEQIALAVVPKITGLISMIFSSLIVYTILVDRQKRSKTYHRLLLGISCVDVSSSLWLALSTWPIPKETGAVWARGNQTTCEIQGFFTMFGGGSSWYNVSLSFFYLLVVRYGWNDRSIWKIEPWLHAVPLAWGLGTAIAGIPLTIFNNANFWCWVAPYRDRGKNFDIYRWAFFYGPLWLMIVIISINLVLLFLHVQRVERTTQRYTHHHSNQIIGTTSSSNIDEQRKPSSFPNNGEKHQRRFRLIMSQNIEDSKSDEQQEDGSDIQEEEEENKDEHDNFYSSIQYLGDLGIEDDDEYGADEDENDDMDENESDVEKSTGPSQIRNAHTALRELRQQEQQQQQPTVRSNNQYPVKTYQDQNRNNVDDSAHQIENPPQNGLKNISHAEPLIREEGGGPDRIGAASGGNSSASSLSTTDNITDTNNDNDAYHDTATTTANSSSTQHSANSPGKLSMLNPVGGSVSSDLLLEDENNAVPSLRQPLSLFNRSSGLLAMSSSNFLRPTSFTQNHTNQQAPQPMASPETSIRAAFHSKHHVPKRLRRKRKSRSRQVANQSLLYAGACYFTWIAITIVRIMQSLNSVVPFALLVLAVATTPLQGLPNFLVYLAPKFLKARRRRPNAGIWNWFKSSLAPAEESARR